MATNLLSLFLLLLIAVTATARPCKTIFYLSSSTTTTTTYFPNSQNPSHVTLIFTTVTTRFRNPISDDQQQSSRVTSSPGSSSSSIFPLKLYSSVSSSIGERSKDIMSVVGALLFGVGCGALTAATVFFIWALCSPRGYEFDDEDEEEETKAMGYVTIDDDLEKKNKKGVV